MSNFRTEFKLEKADYTINHEDKTVLYGSCFAQEMGTRMKNAGFKLNLNSHGIQFNPISIKSSLSDVLKKKRYSEKDLYLHNNLWHSLNHHGNFSGIEVEKVLANINSNIQQAHRDLMEADTLILTFGSAWVYQWNENERVVANCHKIPQHQFNKRKLGVNEIISELSSVFDRVIDVNPDLKIILTISPVRYLKEGLVENNWSKSTLNIAVHELIRRFEQCSYFPAYELIIDDLRDYRFFAEDMIHPSKQAVDYVWQKFSLVYFDEETQKLIKRIEKINRATAHRTLHTDNPETALFNEKLKREKEEIKIKYPFLNI